MAKCTFLFLNLLIYQGLSKVKCQSREKEKLPDEGQRGLMVYFDEDKVLPKRSTAPILPLKNTMVNFGVYDEKLVRQLVEKITVYGEHINVEFKSGIEFTIEQ